MSFPKYEHYKDSGVEWLGEVPAHWRVDRIKASIVSSRNGIWGDEAKNDESDLVCIRVADFDRQSLTIKIGEKTIRNITEKERVGRLLSNGNLLLEKSGGGESQPVGCVVLYDSDEPAVCSNFVARVELAHGMDPAYWRYLHFAAYSVRLTVGSINQTSGIQNLDQDRYFNERACFPPLKEQQAISCFLARETTKLDALITEQRTLIDLLKEKRQAVISHAVTKGLDPRVPMKDSGVEWLGEVPAHWEVVRVRHAVTIDNSPRFPINREERAEMAGQYPYWGPTGVIDHIDHFRYEGARALIGEDGDHFTKHSIWPMTQWATGQFNVNNHAHVIADGPKCLARWFYFSFLHRDIGSDLIAQGVSRLKLTREGLSNLWLAVPPLDEQIATMSHLEAMIERQGEIIKNAQLQISLLEERRSALISAAVTGKIDVRQAA